MKKRMADIGGKSESITRMLIRSFIFLILFVLGIVAAALFIYYYWVEYYPNTLDVDRILSQESLLRQEDYKGIRTRGALDPNGYFEVADRAGHVLYCSREDISNTYTADMLTYVPDAESGIAYTLVPLAQKGAAGSEESAGGAFLLRYDNDAGDAPNGIAVLNAAHKVLYSNMEIPGNGLSSRAYQYLYEDGISADVQGTLLFKYAFKTDKGDQRYLLLHVDTGVTAARRERRQTILALTLMMIGAVILAILLSGIHLSGRIAKPAAAVQKAALQVADGTYMPIEEPAAPAEIRQVIAAFNAMEEVIQTSEKERQKINSQKRAMLADISHDLKTPITVISGYAEALEDGLIPSAEQGKYLTIIRQKAELLTELINSFSERSKLDHPDFHLDRKEGDLCEYTREYAAEKYEELELAGYPFEVDIPEEKLPALFDPLQLKRVFENILSNSLRYTDPGTVLILRIHRNVDGRAAVIEMGDRGPGIPEKYRDTIFDAFVVGDEARSSSGSGLGLSIARTIVEKHGGTIRLSGEPKGGGTLFIIEMPLMG